MLARIMGKTIEIPNERLAKGGVDRVTRGSNPVQKNGEPLLAQTQAGAIPAPSPLIFVLKGQMKSGKNRVLITRTGHRYSPKEFQQWRADMLEQIGLVEYALTGPVSLIADYVPGDLIKRDVDGMLSALFHVIVKAGILLDDAQVKNVQWYQWPLNREQPQCRVTIEVLS